MNKEDVAIAVDGSLYKHHPKYQKFMTKFISELAPNHKVSFCSYRSNLVSVMLDCESS